MIQIFGTWIAVSLLQLSWIWLFWQRDGSGCPFFYWEADYIKHILKMLKEGGNGTCEAQSEGESNTSLCWPDGQCSGQQSLRKSREGP